MTDYQVVVSEREKRNAERSYTAATQGMVLLKNDNSALPIARGGKTALLGLGAVRTVRGGTGSGDPFNGGLSGGGQNDVDQSPRYHIHILDAFEDGGYDVVSSKLLREYAVGYDKEKNVGTTNPMATFAYPDMELCASDTEAMAKQCDTAIYVLSRNAGEGSDRGMTKKVTVGGVEVEIGDYKLCERELENLRKVKAAFKKTVLVLNAGGTIDLSAVTDIDIDSILLMGQAGQEGGRAVRDVLNGTVNPSGKLTSTWALRYADYPAAETFANNDGNAELEKYEEGIYVGYRYFDSFGIDPLYAFGHGLSYTTFDIAFKEATLKGDNITILADVTNTGAAPGKEVVQVYFSAPDSELEMPVQELITFHKTKELAPGEKEPVTLSFPAAGMASFDEKREAYILSAGDYRFHIGASSRDTKAAFVVRIQNTIVTEIVRTEYPLCGELREISRKGKPAFMPENADGCPVITVNQADSITVDSRSEYHDESVITYTTDSCYKAVMPYEKVRLVEKREIKLMDVVSGRATLEELVALMTPEQLAALNCGTGWGVADEHNPVVGGSSESVPGAAGETTHILEKQFGIPSMIVADGPGGIRVTQEFEATDVASGRKVTVHHYCTAWPVGTLLAQSFDPAVPEIVGRGFAEELDELGIAIVLGPGMNIMRDPLCGRNFEYFSEDPRLTGTMAAAMTKGIQSLPGVGACVKHYAANNQETNRNHVDTWVGQRALREIYLKGFEIAVREAQPMSIMTSYNLINGVPTADSFDLCTDIARGEWGFKGLVMTDWNGGSSTPSKSMHAGNDLIMPGGATRVMNILLAFNTIKPQFGERGQVLMTNTPPFPIYTSNWNSFMPDRDGGDTVTARVAEGHKAEVKDGVIFVDGEPLYTEASGIRELMVNRENFKPFSMPATTDIALLSEDGKAVIYKGTLNETRTICLGDVQRCAVNNLNIIMRSVAMKRLYPDYALECYR